MERKQKDPAIPVYIGALLASQLCLAGFFAGVAALDKREKSEAPVSKPAAAVMLQQGPVK